MMNDMTVMMNEYDVIGINQCLRLQKAELNTKNSTKRRRKASFGWVFGVQLGLLEKSAPSDAENRVLSDNTTARHKVV